jgi:hypothetical protein
LACGNGGVDLGHRLASHEAVVPSSEAGVVLLRLEAVIDLSLERALGAHDEGIPGDPGEVDVGPANNQPPCAYVVEGAMMVSNLQLVAQEVLLSLEDLLQDLDHAVDLLFVSRLG